MNVKKNFSILLIESSMDEGGSFVDIVNSEYSYVNVKVLANSFEAIKYLQEEKIFNFLVIEEDAKPMNANQFSNYLSQELKIQIPVFTSSKIDFQQPRTIQKPFTKASLESFLLFLDKGTISERRIYSLNYLREISGGNTEFILESIKIFQSTVKKQLEELELAYERNDKERAGELAHNMKPSFEMLENIEGTTICNKIINEIEDHELLFLIQKLRKIFDELLQQLKKDFSFHDS